MISLSNKTSFCLEGFKSNSSRASLRPTSSSVNTKLQKIMFQSFSENEAKHMIKKAVKKIKMSAEISCLFPSSTITTSVVNLTCQVIAFEPSNVRQVYTLSDNKKVVCDALGKTLIVAFPSQNTFSEEKINQIKQNLQKVCKNGDYTFCWLPECPKITQEQNIVRIN